MHQLDDLIKHSGVKGMKWGVRKRDRKSSELSLNDVQNKKIKLPSGETISVSKDAPPALGRFVARMHPSLSDKMSRTAVLTLSDSKGSKVGDAQIYRESKDEMNLVWLGVKNEARGRGIGTAVVQATVGYAKEHGVKKLTLEVPGNSPDARHIYSKIGFKDEKVLSTKEDDSTWGGLTKMSMDISDDIKQGGVKMHELNEFLQHSGVKGMKWGVRRDRNRPGGADGKDNSPGSKSSGGSSDSGAPEKKKGFIKTRMDSSKRERDWNKVLRNVNNMSNDELTKVTRRIQLENELKRHSKQSKTDKASARKDYLNRADMSDSDLAKRVTQLRVKENLHRSVKEATDGQQEVGQRVVKAASTLALSYAINKTITPKDILAATVIASTSSRKSLKGLDKEAATTEIKTDLNRKANEYMSNTIRPKK